MFVVFAAVGALLAAACRTPPPPQAARAGRAEVRAATAEAAARAAALQEELTGRLATLVPGLREREIEIWLQPRIELRRGEPYPEHVAGLAEAEEGRIYLREGDEDLALHLAHELVHVLADDRWKRLPGAAEEGLCDLAAVLAVPGPGRRQHVKRLVEASACFGGFDVLVEVAGGPAGAVVVHRLRLTFADGRPVDRRTLFDLGDEEVFRLATGRDGRGLYGLGYLVVAEAVRREGLSGLYDLCRRAEEEGLDPVPAAWLLEAAGLDGGEPSFRRALGRLLDDGELPVLGEVLADGLAEATLEAARARTRFAGPDDFLLRGAPAIGLPGRRGRFPLGALAAFREALRRAWGPRRALVGAHDLPAPAGAAHEAAGW